MLLDKHQKQLVIDRCWYIYDQITNTFHVDDDFHVDYLLDVESALLTNRLYFKVKIEHGDNFIIIQEDYDFHLHELSIEGYSYILTDKTGHTVIWSDPAPHHKLDYRGQALSHFPHHLHDSKGRICNFSGKIEDFLMEVKKMF